MSRRLIFHCAHRWLIPLMILATLLLVLLPTSVVRADDVVTFPDPNLEAVIRSVIDKPTGYIYQSDLVGLTYLNAVGFDITNLTGLEHCTSLTYLNLHLNRISDISTLSRLTRLTSLDLQRNEVSNIAALSGLTSLTYLNLDANYRISDISPLSGLTSLTELFLQNNQVGNISALSSLTSLTHLYLSVNQVGNISALSGLTNLVVLLLDVNQISDISPLSGLTSLSRLQLGQNQISNIQPLINNSGLSAGDVVLIATNYLTGTSVNVYIPQLQARGVSVTWQPVFPLNTPVGPPVSMTLSCAAVTFDTVTIEGHTTCTSQQGNPYGTMPEGFRVQGQFVDITTSATYDPPVTVGISYAPSTPNPQNLKLFHWEGGHWVDVTTWVDTTNRIVYGEVTSFSWFFIGGQWVWVDDGGSRGVPVFPSIYIGIGAALGAGILAYLLRRRLVQPS